MEKNIQGRFVQSCTTLYILLYTETESDPQIGMLSLNNTCKDYTGIVSSKKTMAFLENNPVKIKQNSEG